VDANPDGATLRERMRKLVPDLASQAAEAEGLRRPTDAAIRALEQADLFRMMVPRCHGGLELDLDDFVEVGLTLAEADTSLAWVSTFCIEHNWMLCQFPESFQSELYRDRSYVLAPAVINPTGGHARPEADGFRLSGRWQWGTGAMHASWAIVGGLIEGLEGPEALRFFALPMEDVRVDDTWYVDGMVATGSNDLVIEDAFVPEARTVSIREMGEGCAPGSRIHDAPLYRTPMIPILLLAASMPVIGHARSVLAGFQERLHGKGRMNLGMASERAASLMRLGRATVEQQQAELALRDVARQVMELRNRASLLDRSRWAATLTGALHQSRQLVLDVAEASGASAHFQSHPLQRAVRDANVAICHVAFDRDAHHELLGKLLLGIEVGPALI
jgi:3-hydroxy-9,10-secoandrosta-1,3,5(10)-triene-9,17-dione monooxygenase